MSIRGAAEGAALGGAGGFVAGAAIGVVKGAVETVNPLPIGKNGLRMPGLVKTALWGAAGFGLGMLLATNPATMPIAALIALKTGLGYGTGSFVLGAGARAVKNVVFGGIASGVAGAGYGGAGGAIVGSMLD